MDPTQTHGAFSWMEHHSEDVARAQSFYRQVIGWNPLEMPLQDGSQYAGISLGDKPIGGFVDKPGQQWLPYITVDDVDTRTEIARKAGGQVLTEPFDAPGVGRIVVLQDPTGASVALIRYQAP
ncbi:MAG: VOC family protein [Deltaproteobacteria bacterium]|nr:VOC family protein [Deltaproteobacteria bacterium]